MYFEALIKCVWDEKTSYEHYYIIEAENQAEAIRKTNAFISVYYVDEAKGTLLVDHDNIAYKFSDGETVELIKINETTPEKFLKSRIGRLFLIGSEDQNGTN